ISQVSNESVNNIPENVSPNDAPNTERKVGYNGTDTKTSIRPSKVENLGKMNNPSDRAILRNIYFDFGDTQVTNESLPILQAILKRMQESPRMKIEIAGHTDNIGDNRTNQWISQKRANAVKKWLVDNGVSEDRMTARGYGENQPMATNDDELEGRELNRRIEVIVR
ncbi:MAG: OmpA family protein, partial [Bacteroidota bacterium]